MISAASKDRPAPERGYTSEASVAVDTTRTALLKLDNISKIFGGVKALQAIRFDVMPGEVLCLAGENGCGKSTLIKVISGVYQPEPDAVMLMDGQSIEGLDPAKARELGIQVIWQDLALFPEMTVAENIAFEQNLGPRPRLVNYRQMKVAARRILERLGVSIDLGRPVRSLSRSLPLPERSLPTRASCSWTNRRHRSVTPKPRHSLTSCVASRLTESQWYSSVTGLPKCSTSALA
jgi:simple sugar transport system ATP-binding protein